MVIYAYFYSEFVAMTDTLVVMVLIPIINYCILDKGCDWNGIRALNRIEFFIIHEVANFDL